MWSILNYEQLIYQLPVTSTHIESSTLVLQRRGKYYCWLVGAIFFYQNIRLEITEALDFSSESIVWFC